MLHALEYAMFMDAAAERRECSSSTARSSRATPGPKHFSSPKIRMVRTGLKICSILKFYHAAFVIVNNIP